MKAIFGNGPKDEKQIGFGVYKKYGIGEEGFDIVSNQFLFIISLKIYLP